MSLLHRLKKKKNESISYPEVKQDIWPKTWINLSQDLVIRENIPNVFWPKSKTMQCHVNYKHKDVGTSVTYLIKKRPQCFIKFQDRIVIVWMV